MLANVSDQLLSLLTRTNSSLVLQIVSGEREKTVAASLNEEWNFGNDVEQSEEVELREEIGACNKRLFKFPALSAGLLRAVALQKPSVENDINSTTNSILLT